MNTRNIRTINELVNHIYIETDFYREYCGYYFGSDSFLTDELFSEFTLNVLEMGKDKVKKDKLITLCKLNQFRYYASRMIKSLVFNPHMSFNKNHGIKGVNNTVNLDNVALLKNEDNEPDFFNQEEIESLIIDIEAFMSDESKSNCSEFDNSIRKLYYEKYNSVRKMAKDSSITKKKSTLHASVQRSTISIRNEFSAKYNKLSLG